jgi:hypothetical protein
MGIRTLTTTAVLLVAMAAACEPAVAEWTTPLDITPRDRYTSVFGVAADRHGDVAAVADPNGKPDDLVVYSSHDRGPFEGERVKGSGRQVPAIGFDLTDALLVLAYKRGSAKPIRVYRRPRGGRFGKARVLDDRPGYPSGIVASPRGDVFAYWRQSNADRTRGGPVSVAIRPAGSTGFGPVQDLSRAGAYAGYPRIVFDGQGNALMSWAIRRRVEYAVSNHGGPFGPAKVLSPAATEYRIASNAAGRVVAVWRDHATERRGVRAALGNVSAGFGGSERIGGKASRGPYVAVDGGGETVAIWRDRSNRLRTAIAPPAGSGFRASRVLAKGYPEQSDVVADGHGTATVAWIDDGALKAARHESGTDGFAKEVVGRGDVRAVSMAVTAGGRTVLAWQAAVRGGEKRIRASVARPGQSFGAVEDVGRLARGEKAGAPGITIGGDGGAFAFWRIDGESPTTGSTTRYPGSYLLP